MTANDSLIVFQCLLSFLRQLIAPNCELLRLLFFGKMISQSLVQISCFHLGQARDPLLFENGFFHDTPSFSILLGSFTPFDNDYYIRKKSPNNQFCLCGRLDKLCGQNVIIKKFSVPLKKASPETRLWCSIIYDPALS